jgi:hypothetical protein
VPFVRLVLPPDHLRPPPLVYLPVLPKLKQNQQVVQPLQVAKCLARYFNAAPLAVPKPKNYQTNAAGMYT